MEFLCGCCWWGLRSILVLFFAVTSAQKTPFSLQQPPSVPMVVSEKCNVIEKIPCGIQTVTKDVCDATGCCFDGLQCYYGNAVTVQCTKDGQFVVVVSKDSTVPQLDLISLSLLGGKEAPCSPVATTDSFAIYNFPVTACGTTMTVAGDYMVYENSILSSYEVGIGPLGSITRDSTYKLLFQCWYFSSEVAFLMVNVAAPVSDTGYGLVAPGPLRVELRLANGQCFTKGCNEEVSAYTSYYQDSDYPVTKVLQQPVYVEVRILGRTDPNIILLLENCWATPTSDPQSLPQWSLIINGCPYQGDKYLTTLVPVDSSSGLPFPTHYKRFILKMFTFVDPASLQHLEEKVFIHCSTAVCHPSVTDSCQQTCSRKGRGVSIVQNNSTDTVVSSGEVVLTAPTTPSFRYAALRV